MPRAVTMRISKVQYTTTHRSISTADDTTFELRRPKFRSSYTLPPSPTRSDSSSSSTDFEFSIVSSSAATDRHQRSSVSGDDLTPADDLFYKGKILPLQLTPRLSLVKSLFFDSSSASSANSRFSNSSSSSSDVVMFREDACESLRPSSVADLAEEDDDDFIISEPTSVGQNSQNVQSESQRLARKSKSFSLAKLSSVFKKDQRKTSDSITISAAASGSVNPKTAARDVMMKYMKKVKPFCEKMSRRHKAMKRDSAFRNDSKKVGKFSDGLLSEKLTISCPASIRSSPCHSGVILRAPMARSDHSSSEELQSAIQGAIAHCKNSMLQSKS